MQIDLTTQHCLRLSALVAAPFGALTVCKIAPAPAHAQLLGHASHGASLGGAGVARRLSAIAAPATMPR